MMRANDEEPLSIEDHILSTLSAGTPQTRQQTKSLPVATLLEPVQSSTLYFVVTTIDSRGRLADQSPLRILGWTPDCAITITTVGRAAIVATRSAGPDAVTSQGHLRLPARVRHVCRLDTGARLLVAASPDRDLLAVYPHSSVEASLLAYHRALRHQDAR
ncbi:hypothetical protein HFP15_03865 [Amycolatopsis sp. K13G38]|uniref:Uncharacterized protein n=1 Tax=Amycolatopsis acididurans TaxID=2724524 RepID=A0ABX1J172_9PSEU|nr:hypothetical protein [Amycolatopsis acididurans]NKQ52012.1 hypothetical protein [Amycolatopsis acididurans]